MPKQKSIPSKKTQKRIFEDISGNNAVFIGEVMSNEGEPVAEFAVVVTDFNNKDLAVSLLSKSDIPRMIRELTKLL